MTDELRRESEPLPAPPTLGRWGALQRHGVAIASNLKLWFSRLALVLLFLIMNPVACGWLINTRTGELHKLAASGLELEATVVQFGGSHSRVAYILNGVSYEAEAPVGKARSIIVGGPIRIRCLPDHPKVIWIGDAPSEDDIAHELVGAKVMFVVTLLVYCFGIPALLWGFIARRRLATQSTEGRMILAATAFKRGLGIAMIIVWLLLTWVMLATQFLEPRIRAVHEKAFGMRPLGLLQECVVGMVLFVLGLPLLWILWQFKNQLLTSAAELTDSQTVALLKDGSTVVVLKDSQTLKKNWQSWKPGLILLGELAVYMFVLMGIWCAYLGFLGIQLPLS